MGRIKILIDQKIPFIKGALDEVADVTYMDWASIRPSDIVDTDAMIIRTRTICNEELLSHSAVKCIATATIGYDHIDTDYCAQKGIYWTNAPGCNSSSVKQYFISAILGLWARGKMIPGDMTIGVIGAGNVGSKVADAAKVLGMKVLLNDPPRERIEGETGFVSLKTIIENADVITFHVPLNMIGEDRTYKMADSDFFSRLSGAVHLINTSRGSVVDEKALLNVIRSGKIRSCTMDVWENEPSINPEMIRKTDFATPHIAGYSTDGKANGAEMSVRAVSRFFNLGLDEWKPANLPAPVNNPLVIDCYGISEMEIMSAVFSKIYSIEEDDRLLRADISMFETLRGNYRVRREPQAFTVRLKNNTFANLPGKLEKLGLTVFVEL